MLLLAVMGVAADESETDLQRALAATEERDQEDYAERKARYFQGLTVRGARVEGDTVVVEAELRFMEWYYAYYSATTGVWATLYRNGEQIGEMKAVEKEVLEEVEEDGGNRDTYFSVVGTFTDREPGPDPASNRYVVAARFRGQHGGLHEIFDYQDAAFGPSRAAQTPADDEQRGSEQATDGSDELVWQEPADRTSVEGLAPDGEWTQMVPDPTLLIKARYTKDMQTLIVTPLVRVERPDGSTRNYTHFMQNKHIIMDQKTRAKLVLGLNGFEFIWFSSYRNGNEIHIPVDDLDPDESGNLKFHFLYYYTNGPTLGRRIGPTTVVKYPDYAARHKRIEAARKAADAKREKEGQTLFPEPERRVRVPGVGQGNKAYDFVKKTYKRAKAVQDLLQDVTGEKLYQTGKDFYGDYASLTKSAPAKTDSYRYAARDRIDNDVFEAKKRGEEVVGGIVDTVKDKILKGFGVVGGWAADWAKKKAGTYIYDKDEEAVKKVEEAKKELGDDDTLKADLYQELNNFKEQEHKKPLDLLDAGMQKLGGVFGKLYEGAKKVYDKGASCVKNMFADKMSQSYKRVQELIHEQYRQHGTSWEAAVATAKDNYLNWDGMTYSRHGLTHSGKYGNDPGKYFDSFVRRIEYNKKAQWDSRYGKQ